VTAISMHHRARLSGRAGASCRMPSSSGRKAASACTTANFIRAKAAAGKSRSCIRRVFDEGKRFPLLPPAIHPLRGRRIELLHDCGAVWLEELATTPRSEGECADAHGGELCSPPTN